MASNALVVAEGTPAALLATEQMAKERKELIRRTVAPNATPAELDLFIYDCLRRGTHPLDRMIHFTKQGDRYTPITGIDYMRALAAETGEHAGTDDAVFVVGDGDPFPVSATVTVYRITNGVRYPYTATARWSEYYPGDAKGFMWRKMPYGQLGKCAEALAHRKAFPRQLGGLYEKAELDQASGAEVIESTPTPPPASAPIIGTPPYEMAAPATCLRCSAQAEHDSDYCATCNRLHADRLADDALASAGLKPVPYDLGGGENDAASGPGSGVTPDHVPASTTQAATPPPTDATMERKRLFAMLREYGWEMGDKGRPERLRLYSRALGREITEAAAKKLTAADWRRIADTVEADNEPPVEDQPPGGLAL